MEPIGITFSPSAQNQAQGPNNLRNEGGIGSGSTDLAQAYKILSLRLPTVVGAQAPVAPALLKSPGSAALPSGMNPQAALFAALLKSMLGVQTPSAGGGGESSFASPVPSADLFGGGSSAPSQSAPLADVGRLVPRIELNDTGQRTRIPEDVGSMSGFMVDPTAPRETNSWLDSMGIDTKNVY
jgi:hypothetical protein